MIVCEACKGMGVIAGENCQRMCEWCVGFGRVTGKVEPFDPRNKAEIALDEAWERNWDGRKE